MSDIDYTLQIAALFLLLLWRIYWHITETQAEDEKPKTKETVSFFHKKNLSKIVTIGAFLPVTLQLLGFELFPLPQENQLVQYLGLLIVFIGWVLSIKGRHDLGTNWARCYDYQVKEKQKLVTSGIYKYIRHPIYSGIVLMFIGGELIVQSYLLIAYVLLYAGAYIQATWEEKLLVKHFGKEYSSYMKRSKRFIPFVI